MTHSAPLPSNLGRPLIPHTAQLPREASDLTSVCFNTLSVVRQAISDSFNSIYIRGKYNATGF